MIEDELLKWKVKSGSREALSRIYAKYVNSMLSLAVGLLNDPHEAQDVVQDVFVSFAGSCERLSLTGSLRAYLAKSVVNRVRDRMRSEHSRRHSFATDGATRGTQESPDQAIVYGERCELVSNALAELPYEQREVVMLKIMNDMPLRAIAKLQGVSLSTVHGRYRYGLRKLRTLLNGDL